MEVPPVAGVVHLRHARVMVSSAPPPATRGEEGAGRTQTKTKPSSPPMRRRADSTSSAAAVIIVPCNGRTSQATRSRGPGAAREAGERTRRDTLYVWMLSPVIGSHTCARDSHGMSGTAGGYGARVIEAVQIE